MTITIDPDGLSIKVDKAEDAVQIASAIDDMSKRGVPKDLDELLKQYPALGAVVNDPKATPFQKKMAAMPVLKKLKDQADQSLKAAASLREKKEFCDAILEASKDFPVWEKLPPKLEKNDCSRLHMLIEDLRLAKKYIPEAQHGDDIDSIPWNEVVPFVVQHDWAAAFANAGDYAGGGFNLPYPYCAFEFRITGRSVTVLAFQAEGCEPNFTIYVQFGKFWVSHDERPEYQAERFAMEQIKAICVALDAEVATKTMVRAPEKLNRKRQAEGKLPLYGYHVVSLNRRYRVTNPSVGGGVPLGKKRLHFRRGHWRHYAEFKTWVRWCLVGNPELGFIDKEYRL